MQYEILKHKHFIQGLKLEEIRLEKNRYKRALDKISKTIEEMEEDNCPERHIVREVKKILERVKE